MEPLKQCIRVLLTLLFMDSGDCHISPNAQASFDILTKLSGGEPVAQYWLGDGWERVLSAFLLRRKVLQVAQGHEGLGSAWSLQWLGILTDLLEEGASP